MKVTLYICIHCKGIRIIAFEKYDKTVNIAFNLYLPLDINEDIVISEKNLAKKIVKKINDNLVKNKKIKIKKIFFCIDNKSVKNIETNIIGLKKDKDIKSVIKMKLQHEMDINLEQNSFLYSKEKLENGFEIYIWIVENKYFKLFMEIAKNLKVIKCKIFCGNEILKKFIKKQTFTIDDKEDLLLVLCYENETKFCVINEKNIQSIIYIKDNEYIDKSIKNYFLQIKNKLFWGENKKSIEANLGVVSNTNLLKNGRIVECNKIYFEYCKFILDYEQDFINFNLNKNISRMYNLGIIFCFIIFITITFLSVTINIKNKQIENIMIKKNEKIQQLKNENNLEGNKEDELKRTYSQDLKDIYNNVINEKIKTLEISDQYIKLDFTTYNLNNKLIKIPLLENTYIKSIEKTNDKNKKENDKSILEIKFVSNQIKK